MAKLYALTELSEWEESSNVYKKHDTIVQKAKYVLAIDQGTSSTKSIVFDDQGNAISKGHQDLLTNYFDNGFVEQTPEDIYQNVLASVNLCLTNFVDKGYDVTDIASCGISNQRETFILWDKSGKALTPAIVWACKRSIEICQKLLNDKFKIPPTEGWGSFIKQKTGLIIDPYFSGTKLLWLIENIPLLKTKLDDGDVYFGTVDTWLLFKMTQGKSFKTDYTNASRTLLFNINTLQWDKNILELWGLEKLNLPEICPSSHHFGWLNLVFLNESQQSKIPIHAMIGDSHAAAFGEGCFESGTAKATMGTGCSIMMNIGEKPVISQNGMLTTICWSTENRIDYALEGAVVSCGSTIEWLKNELNLFAHVAETEKMAMAMPDNAGVYLVPAFSGLGSPHWQMNRRASLEGMTFGTTKNHIVRAALESMAYQIKDVVLAMTEEIKGSLISIAVNGGMTKNKFVLQFLTDLLGVSVKIQRNFDISALGAAYLAGLKSGVYESIDQLSELNRIRTDTKLPDTNNEIVKIGYNGWKDKITQGKV